MKILFLLFLIAMNTSNVFGATAPEKEKFEGGFQRLMSFMHSTFPKGRGEKAEITADNPLANFALEFIDQTTLDKFVGMGRISITVTPFLATYEKEKEESFHEGMAGGVPYTIFMDEESIADLRMSSLGKATLLPMRCDTASNGMSGYCYLWDKFQIVKLGRLQIAVIDSKEEIHPFIDYDVQQSAKMHYLFPFSLDFVNDVASHHWNILNIRLSWTEEGGWVFTPSLINRLGKELKCGIRNTSIPTSRQLALRKSCQSNARARRNQVESRFVVEELKGASGGVGAAAGDTVMPSPVSRATVDEESIEYEP